LETLYEFKKAKAHSYSTKDKYAFNLTHCRTLKYSPYDVLYRTSQLDPLHKTLKINLKGIA